MNKKQKKKEYNFYTKFPSDKWELEEVRWT